MEKYDYEIAFVDLWIKKLFAALGELGLADDTAVVVMADHGEAFGEHKTFFHGQDLFDEQLRVPLIIAVPGQAPQRVRGRGVAGRRRRRRCWTWWARRSRRASAARACCRASRRRAAERGPIFSELMPATAWPHHAAMMVDGKYKVIHRVSDRRWEMYDLAR